MDDNRPIDLMALATLMVTMATLEKRLRALVPSTPDDPAALRKYFRETSLCIVKMDDAIQEFLVAP